MNREAQIAEFRAKTQLSDFVAEWIEDFLDRAAMDDHGGPPIDAKTALIELSARALMQALIEGADGADIPKIVDAMWHRFREMAEENWAAQDVPQ